jgi:ribosomal protein L40E
MDLTLTEVFGLVFGTLGLVLLIKIAILRKPHGKKSIGPGLKEPSLEVSPGTETRYGGGEMDAPQAAESPPAKAPNQKFCSDCGALIFLRAEICPKCGCRQITPASMPGVCLQVDAVTGPMILLIICNFLWSGLGNLVIGDDRGWGYGFFNWVVFAVSFFTLFIPSILFFAYCSWQGYQFLRQRQLEQSF